MNVSQDVVNASSNPIMRSSFYLPSQPPLGFKSGVKPFETGALIQGDLRYIWSHSAFILLRFYIKNAASSHPYVPTVPIWAAADYGCNPRSEQRKAFHSEGETGGTEWPSEGRQDIKGGFVSPSRRRRKSWKAQQTSIRGPPLRGIVPTCTSSGGLDRLCHLSHKAE